MRPRDVLAKNLSCLMAAFKNRSTVKEVALATGIPTGTVDRIKRAQVATSVDNLQQLAEAFNLRAMDLLADGLSVVVDSGGNARVVGLPDWPFAAVDEQRYRALSPEDRGFVQARAASAIEEREAASARSMRMPPHRKPPEIAA